ncbi:MAG: fibrobacter succinogenes major paralogous domain-containing protein [Chitinispirillia bacterium]|nr:fibrobacter succinogenes major paralogous domain-containing protein [Chitinispirillia bacterium]
MSIITAIVLSAALLFAAHANPGAGTFTDSRDGKVYRTVRMGDLTWMAENLNFKTGGSRCYGNKESNCQKYGLLYDWTTAMSACPAGWRLPARNDWADLVKAAGGEETAGKKLKSKTGWGDWTCDKGMVMDGRDCTLWRSYSGNGSDDFGFSAMPGGSRVGADFDGSGGYGQWWSATKNASGQICYWGILDSHNEIVEVDLDESVLIQFGGNANDFKNASNSVRCVQE